MVKFPCKNCLCQKLLFNKLVLACEDEILNTNKNIVKDLNWII